MSGKTSPLTPLSLSIEEARMVEAVAARVIPSETGSPGAREARVVQFVDTALGNDAADLLPAYRAGAVLLDDLSQSTHGVDFADLDASVQDDVLRQIETGPLPPSSTGRAVELASFFALVREHTLQGMFCDPEYGGNFQGVGWQLVGFPGAQWGYSEEQMRPGFDATTIPIATLADLRLSVPVRDSGAQA